jgi:hypothetical protein
MKRYLQRYTLNRDSSFVALFLFFLFSFFLMTHTFGYDSAGKNFLIARTVWSDFGSHIPLVRSFSMGGNLDRFVKRELPEYPLFSGEPIRYHFLFYLFVGLLERIGVPVNWAMNIPSILGFFALLLGIYTLSYRLFHSYRVSLLSVIFFLFNGSLAFRKFFLDHPLSLQTPMDVIRADSFPAFGPWDGGQITAFWNLNIYTNQRHLAPAFAVGIWFLVWVIGACHRRAKVNLPSAVCWGLIIGILPYFHQPMLVVMAVFMGTCFLFFPRLRLPLAVAGTVGLLLVAPQILAMPKGGPPVAWHPGYLVYNVSDPVAFLSFWFANLGLHAILIPAGFFLLPKGARRILFGLFVVFAVGNLFTFSVEAAANHKFFNFALILGGMISASVIGQQKTPSYEGAFGLGDAKSPRPDNQINPIMDRIDLSSKRYQAWILIVKAALVVFLTLSGIIDFFVIVNDRKGMLADVGGDPAATWIAANTRRDAVFLNSSFLYHPASLAGRRVFLGWPYFAWSAGYDTYTRNDQMRAMYVSRDTRVFCPLLGRYGITYVTIEDTNNDPNLPTIDPAYFQTLADPVFAQEKNARAIYRTADLCR